MDKVTNKDILVRTRLTYMEDLLIKKNLRWTGHDDVTRRAPLCVCVSLYVICLGQIIILFLDLLLDE